MNELSHDVRDTHGLPITLFITHCNVTLTVTNVMAFPEECLDVFWIYANALFGFVFGYKAPGSR